MQTNKSKLIDYHRNRVYRAETKHSFSPKLVTRIEPMDFLPDDELSTLLKSPHYSPEIIKQLIDCVKSL